MRSKDHPLNLRIIPRKMGKGEKRPAAGVDNTHRRTWDKAEYEEQAAAREEKVCLHLVIQGRRGDHWDFALNLAKVFTNGFSCTSFKKRPCQVLPHHHRQLQDRNYSQEQSSSLSLSICNHLLSQFLQLPMQGYMQDKQVEESALDAKKRRRLGESPPPPSVRR